MRRLAPLLLLAPPPAYAHVTDDPSTLAVFALLAGAIAGYALGRRQFREQPNTLAAAPSRPAGVGEADRAPPIESLQTINRALQESQERYREMVESVNSVIFRLDRSGHLMFLNSAWKRLAGFEIGQTLGRPLTDFLHPDDRGQAQDRFSSLAEGGIADCHCQLRLRTRAGEIRWIELTGRVVHEPAGGHWSLAGTMDDISARKVAELTLRNMNQELESRVRMRTAELEASNKELEAFSYSVSHDLRAPLRAIDGFARIIEDDLGERLDDMSRSHLERIRRATERMANLIDALINLATLTRQPLRKETFDLSGIARMIIDGLRAEEPDRHVEVEITEGLMVTADRVLMHAMLDNLLRNAWKFSSRQPVSRIAFRAEIEENRRVFCVEDNGAGFDMAFAANLFRPFQRLHSSHEFAGTGIGLATVQRIVQRHEGTIWADASPDGGARFRFTLGR